MDAIPVVPEKFSELIRLAVADARSLDRTHYVPSSSVEYVEDVDDEDVDDTCCEVSLAGSVLVGTLRSLDRGNVTQHPSKSDYPEWSSALITLGCVQRGEFSEGLGLHMG